MRRQGNASRRPNILTRAVQGVFDLVRLAEFEILFVLFLAIVLLLFKDLVSRTGREFCCPLYCRVSFGETFAGLAGGTCSLP